MVTILGAMATLALPAMERGVARSKANRAAFAISSELKNAFSLAERQRKPVVINFNTANRTLTISDRKSSAMISRRDFSNQRSPFGLTSMTVSANDISVYPNGTASGPVTVTIGVSVNSRVITMTRVGQVRVQ